MMWYLRVAWSHGFAEEPVEILSVPPLAEINARQEFMASRIAVGEFDRAWRHALSGHGD
ncbi:hypothetical protein [Amycolatopsis sp. NPDC051071]|uniref:hypothetical protein n=1 Tax=Amycolatopsis sp. NPDC051071 TaxID=3154637 RepID=UPI00343238D3